MQGVALLLFCACICIAGWGLNSVAIEVANRRPHEPLFSHRNYLEVDEYIWSDKAPRTLRRKYILTQACAPVMFLCFAWLAWTQNYMPERRVPCVILGGMGAMVSAVILVRRVIKHGL